MATEIFRLVGKAFWAKVYNPDTFMGKTQYKLAFYPDEDQWAKFEASGIQKKVHEDENGKFFELARDASKLIKGNLVHFTGPIVEDQDGGVIVDFISKKTGKRVYSYDSKDKDDIERRGAPILIGNGSKVQVDIAVYDTMKGKGHRLEKIRILDLIEYEGGTQELPEISDLVKEKQLRIREEQAEAKADVNKKTPW